MRQFKTIALRSSATLALLGALSLSAQAQVTITDDTAAQINTSTAGDAGGASDVTVEDGATVTIDSERTGIILDSDNNLTLAGDVSSSDVNNVTGVELQGGSIGSFTQSGSITLQEDFTQEDTDDDPFVDGPFAEGEGRTGILISGASPFQGNVELEASSIISVEGNDSFGINLANTPMMTDGLTGDLLTAGQIRILGDRSTAINIDGNVTGDVTNLGAIDVDGEASQAIAVAGSITGAFESSGAISNTGFRFAERPAFAGEDGFGREDLSAEDLLQAGSAISISGDVTDGILLSQRFEQIFNDDGTAAEDVNGNPTFSLTNTSAISQLGSAPAVIIDGGTGTPIAVGTIVELDADGVETPTQFGFINQGSISAEGVFDDVNSTALSIANVTFTDDPSDLTASNLGISNTGVLTAQSFRAPNATDLADGGDGIARALVLGDQAIADGINNTNLIQASVSEAIDELFVDRDNIAAPRELLAIAIDIEAGATIPEIVNSGQIQTILLGRDGTAVAIRDASGTVASLTNSGSIIA